MRAEDQAELERLKRFALTVADFMLALAPGSPIADLRWQFAGPLEAARSLRGVREAARDMVEWAQDLTAEQLHGLDSQLSAQGLPTLSLMRRARGRDIARILTRGSITSEDEFRLLNGAVADDDGLSPDDRALVEHLLGEFSSSEGA
jgi:ribosomal protein L29